VSAEPALAKIHEQKGKVVENVDGGKRVVELDGIEQDGSAVDLDDVAQMEIAVAVAHIACTRPRPQQGRECGKPLATGLDLSARQWARLGELVLGHGNYHGRQVLPDALLREAFSGSQANPSYGLTFWLNREAPNGREIDIENMLVRPWTRESWSATCICRDAPPDMVVSLGSGYQRLFIIPSMNALIVRQGSNAKFSDAKFLRMVLGR